MKDFARLPHGIIQDFARLPQSRILLHFPPFRTLLKTWGSSGKLALLLALVKLEVVHLFMGKLGMLKLEMVLFFMGRLGMLGKGSPLWPLCP